MINCQFKIWLKKYNLTRSIGCHWLHHVVCRAYLAKSLPPMIEGCGLNLCLLLCESVCDGCKQWPERHCIILFCLHNKCQQGPNFSLLNTRTCFSKHSQTTHYLWIQMVYPKIETGNIYFTTQGNTTTLNAFNLIIPLISNKLVFIVVFIQIWLMCNFFT